MSLLFSLTIVNLSRTKVIVVFPKSFCVIKRVRTCHLLFKKPECYHSASKIHVRGRIFKLSPNHASDSPNSLKSLNSFRKTPLGGKSFTRCLTMQRQQVGVSQPLNLYSQNDKVPFVGSCYLPKISGQKGKKATNKVTLRATNNMFAVYGTRVTSSREKYCLKSYLYILYQFEKFN